MYKINATFFFFQNKIRYKCSYIFFVWLLDDLFRSNNCLNLKLIYDKRGQFFYFKNWIFPYIENSPMYAGKPVKSV